MKKLTQLTTIALFGIFLTACDKPAEKNAQPQSANSVEKTVDHGAEDYKTFREWQHSQEQKIHEAMAKTIEQLGEKAKDEQVLQEAVNKTLLEQVENIKKSAEQLTITDSQVKLLKDKSLEALALGAEMIAEADKIAKNPTEEAHKAFSELQAKVEKIAQEGKALEAELLKKYEPAALSDKATTPNTNAGDKAAQQ